MPMLIILINHGERDRASGKKDDEQPLDPKKGVAQVEQLVNRLQQKNIKPSLYLTSRNVHAIETAEIICKAFKGDPAKEIVELDALTPDNRTETMQDIEEQAGKAGHDLLQYKVIAIVGHSPRLEQMFAYLTYRTVAPLRLNYGQETYLTISKFHDGKGKGEWPSKTS